MKKDILQTAAFLIDPCSTTIRRFDESYKQEGEKYIYLNFAMTWIKE